MKSLSQIVEQLTAPSVQRDILGWKILSLLFSGFFLSVIIYARKKTSWARRGLRQTWHEFRNREALEKSRFEEKWLKIKKRLEKGRESEGKLAVIEADEMLAGLLKRLGYPGQSVRERLKKVEKGTISNPEDLRKVRRLRDDIVHDPDYHLSLKEVRWGLSVYEATFRSLGAL